MLDLFHREAGRTVFIALSESVYKMMKEIGISPALISVDIQRSWEDRDKAFRELAMPGDLDGIKLPHSEFPVWKSLGLDRLYFWYRGASQERFLEIISAIQCDRIYTSLDLRDPTSWAVASIKPTTAVQTDSLKTREIYDLAPFLPYDEIIVWDESTKAALTRWGWPGQTKVVSFYPYQKVGIDPEQKKKLLEGLGLLEQEKVRAVVYTPQTEYTFRAFATNGGLATRSIIITSSKHDTEQVYELAASQILRYRAIVTEDRRLIGATDEIVCFMYSEEISNTYSLPVGVMDMKLRHLSDETAKE